MAQNDRGSEGIQGDLRDLWMLLTAAAGVSDELERSRLLATGIPSLVECDLSGVALRQGVEASWTLLLQRDGSPVSAPDLEPVIPELDRLFSQAMSGSGLQLIGAEMEADSPRVPSALQRLGASRLAVVPLLTLDSQLGMLLVARRRGEPFSDREELVLYALADHLATGIENLRLQESLQRHSDELELLVEERTAQLRQSEEKHRVLLEINNAIIANLDRKSLFEAIAPALRRVLPFDRASLALHNPANDTLRISALVEDSELKRSVSLGSEFPLSGSHLHPVIDQKKPRIRGDLQNETRIGLENRLLESGIRSYVSAPLLVRGRAIGTLNIASKTAHLYSNAEADFLSEVARQVALAIENMLSYEEIAQLKARLEQENLYLQEEIKTQHGFEEIVGSVPAVKQVLKAIETVAPTDATVLVTGETGTGKELVARAVHDLSPRKGKTLVKVNCAALPAGLIESELFGHEKGAFTGATARKLGRFELAHSGTIFLDEIGDLPLELQAKLLRVLQDGAFERVGGSQTIEVDVRVIAATNCDLEEAIQTGKFRPDLYYRLNVFPIRMPALRERKEDIKLLIQHLTMKYAAKMGKRIESISKDTLAALQAYDWPGNVRELQNVIERAVILTQGPALDITGALPRPPPAAASTAAAPGTAVPGRIPTLEELDRNHIVSVLERTGWRVGGEEGAAKILGVKRTTLQARMQKLGIQRNP